AGGLVWANLLRPGAGVAIAGLDAAAPTDALSLADLVLGIVPANPIEAMATGNVLQVIFFALLTGLAINAVGEAAAPLRRFFNAAAEIVYKITHWVMEAAPYGVFALIAWVAGTNGIAVLRPLAMLIVTLYVACLVHMALVSGLLVGVLARLNLWQFLRGIRDAQLVAFSTSTSSGTLPVTLTCAQENLGISRGVSSFVLPVGATMNMDGTAIYMGIAAVFTAQAVGVTLDMADYGAIILSGTLASIGAAGVPSAGLILIPLVLSSVGLPVEAIAVIAGIDRVLDMMRTATNVTGDAAVATVVAKSEGELDEAVFAHRPVV
ncbi:MAG: dicarboxylate/amino acid:cation symporter, partial [Alphaproteobacteria bacterium]